MLQLTPITLTGKYAKLVPLSHEHTEGLKNAVVDGKIHELWYTSVPAPSQMTEEITKRLNLMDQGTMLPFTVIEQSTARIVGMTTFFQIDYTNKRLEIGYTWYAQSVQKSALNSEVKLLLLSYAFEHLKLNAVELRTNQYNLNSRRAIERLGAKQDGILRNARLLDNGAICDTYVYSIIASEWLAVKTNLESKLMSIGNN